MQKALYTFSLQRFVLDYGIDIQYSFRVLCDNESHVCNKRCFETCGLCSYKVEKTLNCGHLNKLPCYTTRTTKLSELTCQFPCDGRIEKCGHICTLTCHVDDDPEHKNVSVYYARI